jgi:branched-chain amino acid transport system ATP-binding protein
MRRDTAFAQREHALVQREDAPVQREDAPLLLVSDIDAGYGRVRALAHVSLVVARGELVTIVGPNGSGKTTLLRAITGLVTARAGAITFDGVSISDRETEAIVRRGIALVPEGRDLFGPLTVSENLLLGAFSRAHATRRERLRDLERVVGLFPSLAGRLGQPAGTLSGGEQQMVAIGRALMAHPRLLLLDEPSVGLAPLVIRDIFAILARLKAEGLTILLVEQNARAAFSIADRAYVLEPGGVLRELARGSGHADDAREAYGLAPIQGDQR